MKVSKCYTLCLKKKEKEEEQARKKKEKKEKQAEKQANFQLAQIEFFFKEMPSVE